MRDYTTIEEKINYLRRLWEMHEKLCPYFNLKLDKVENSEYLDECEKR